MKRRTKNMGVNMKYKFFSGELYILEIGNFSLHATSKARNEFRLELNEVLCMDAVKEDWWFFYKLLFVAIKANDSGQDIIATLPGFEALNHLNGNPFTDLSALRIV
jgi:hypothetical protein